MPTPGISAGVSAGSGADAGGAAPDAGAAAPGGVGGIPSPSVKEKNRSSSVTVWGAMAWMSAPDSTSACESAPAASSSAVNDMRPCSVRTLVDPRLDTAHRQRALVVGGLQPVARAGSALERGDLALVDDPALAHDRHPVAHVLHLGEQMAGEQHGHALVGEAADEQAHVAHARRVEPGRGLVEQQQLGITQERGGDPQPLAHAVRVTAHPVALAAGQLHRVQRLVDPLGRAAAVVGGQHLQVLAGVEVGVEGRGLDEAGHPLERPHARHRVAPEEPHRPLGRPDEPEHHPQRRRLARAVGPEVAVDVPGLHGQVDPAHGGELPVALDQPAHLDRRRGGWGQIRTGRLTPCRTLSRVVGVRGHGADAVSARAAVSAAYGATEPSTV